MFAAAAMAGLGFYTIYMGRVAAVVLVMFALLVYRARPPGRFAGTWPYWRCFRPGSSVCG